MNDNNGTEFGMLVSFIDQSHSFTHGFEMGILWRRMETENSDIEMMIHEENCEQVSLMAKALEWKIDSMCPMGMGWHRVQMSKPAVIHKPRLRLVE